MFLERNRFIFSADFVEIARKIFNTESQNLNSYSQILDFYKYLEANSDEIDFLEPLKFKMYSKSINLKKKGDRNEKLISPMIFLNNFFLNNNDLKFGEKKSNENFYNYDLMIFNYDLICDSTLLILHVIRFFFQPIPLQLSKSEKINFIKKRNIDREILFYFLIDWANKRPEDFKEGSLAYVLLKDFLRFLKRNNKFENLSNDIQNISKKLNEILTRFKFPKIAAEKTSFKGDKSWAKVFFLTSFNDILIDEFVNILNIIDLKLIYKLNKTSQDEIFLKIKTRFNNLSYFLQYNILINRNSSRFSYIIKRYCDIAKGLHQIKNYSSLYCFTNSLFILGLMDPPASIDHYVRKEIDFFLKLFNSTLENIKEKMKIDRKNKYPCIPIINGFLREKEFKNLKNPIKKIGKEEFLDIEVMQNISNIQNEIYEMKLIVSENINKFCKNFVKNDAYYFLKTYFVEVLTEIGDINDYNFLQNRILLMAKNKIKIS